MAAEESLSHIQFHQAGNRRYQLEHGAGSRWVEARSIKPSGDLSKKPVGALNYFDTNLGAPDKPDGPTVFKAVVSKPHQRKGLASAMFDFADQHAQARYGKPLQHSSALSEDGKAFVAGHTRKKAEQ